MLSILSQKLKSFLVWNKYLVFLNHFLNHLLYLFLINFHLNNFLIIGKNRVSCYVILEYMFDKIEKLINLFDLVEIFLEF